MKLRISIVLTAVLAFFVLTSPAQAAKAKPAVLYSQAAVEQETQATEAESAVGQEEQAPEVEPAVDQEEQAPEAEPAVDQEEQAPEAEPAVDQEEQAPEVEPAVDQEEQAPEAEPVALYCQAAVEQEAPAEVHAQIVDGELWLFLPASSDLSVLTLYFDGDEAAFSANGSEQTVQSGEAFDLMALFPEAPDDGIYTVEMAQQDQTHSLHIMISANTASLFLTSADPDSKGRAWVDLVKGNRSTGQACMLSPQGETIYAGGVKQIKGRGNSTWHYPKKPYQIKLSTAADLMENGETATTWVLLANYCDKSLIHNRFTYDLALDLDLAYSPHCRPVDLYYDGEYRGSYLLSEKTEIKTNRVEVTDLEKAIEKANPDISDFADLPVVLGSTSAGNPCQYISGITLPEDYSGGYLLEVDYGARAKQEASWFSTSLKNYIVVKSPEYLPEEAMDYISAYWQEFEDALEAGGVNPVTGKSYDAYVDATSLAKVYLLEELSHDIDSFRSSCFFYKDAGDDRIYAGPVWDFDSSYSSAIGPTELSAGQTGLGRLLLAIPSFREEVQRCWIEQLYPLLQEYVSEQSDRSITSYGSELMASQRMDAVLWPAAAPADYGVAVANFQSFISQRTQWLQETVPAWTEDTVIPFLFVDVDPNSWYSDAVSYVSKRGLFSGTFPVLFSPQTPMTRAMAVTVLYRLAGTPVVSDDEEVNFYDDVSKSNWYSDAIIWAVSNNIVHGFDDGGFHPYEPVNRQDLVTFLYNFAQVQGVNLTTSQIPDDVYTDQDSIDSWAEDAFAWAIHQGIIIGSHNGALSPQDTVLRNQAAVIFQRFDQLLKA